MADELTEIYQDGEDQKLARLIKKRYRSGVSYKQSHGYYDDWNEYDKFWMGDQWPEATAKTENFPRPVTNHFASIIEQKVAGITYDMPEMYFDPVEGDPDIEENGVQSADNQGAELLSMVAENQASKLEFDELLDLGVRSAALLGNGIWFYFWDNTIIAGGPNSQYVGDIRGYEVDPADFFPGDPTNRDMQTQPWIIYAERRPLSEVKSFYRKSAPQIVDLLQGEKQASDTQIYDTQSVEQDETDYVDVIHCWWKERKENKTQISKSIEVQEGDVISKDTAEEEIVTFDEVLHYAVECQNYLLRHEDDMQPNLYPFVTFQWYPRRKSFWGKPESADLIANQKEDNRLAGISILAAYNNGIPDVKYNPEYVDEQDLTPGPGGRVIKDTSPGGMTGVAYMDARPPSPHIPKLRESVTGGMKEASGVHEAWSGKAPSGELNASAIMALQEAAGVRMRGIQRRLVKAVKETGELWLAYWKENYTESRLFRKVGQGNKVGFVWFNMTDYADMKFDVRVDAGSASPFSKTMALANLDKLLENQLITPDEYLDLMPADIMPEAKRILSQREQQLEEHFPMIVQKATEAVLQIVTNVLTGQQGGTPPQQPMAVQPQQGVMTP